MRAIEERIASIEGVMAASKPQQQEARSAANLESSLGSHCHSSVASTEHTAGGQPAVVADEPEHYPMDDLIERTPCELLYLQRKKIKLVAHGVAKVHVQGGTIHGMPIPEGYARVMVDRVEAGWEDLDHDIPGGDGEEEQGQVVHTWICWNKRYIRFAQSDRPGTHFANASTPGSEPAISPADQRGPSPAQRSSPAPERSPTPALRSPPAVERSPSPAPRSAPSSPDDARDSCPSSVPCDPPSLPPKAKKESAKA